jgi:hypothetical protein
VGPHPKNVVALELQGGISPRHSFSVFFCSLLLFPISCGVRV